MSISMTDPVALGLSAGFAAADYYLVNPYLFSAVPIVQQIATLNNNLSPMSGSLLLAGAVGALYMRMVMQPGSMANQLYKSLSGGVASYV